MRTWDLQSGQLETTLNEHRLRVAGLTFSPDSRTLATPSEDKTARLWDVESGQLKATLQGHRNWVGPAAFSPDGQTLATGSWDTTVRLWDVPSGQLKATLEGHKSRTAALAFSPDGKTLATGARGGGLPNHFDGGHIGYQFEVDTKEVHSGRYSASIRFLGPRTLLGALMQSLLADAFRGKRVRLSGYLKTEGVTAGWAGLGMFASRRDLVLKYENMEDLGVRGSTDWQRCEITMDVPREATQIRFAVLLHGKGKLWADDLKLELLDEAGQARRRFTSAR